MNTDLSQIDSSFRDPSGFLFIEGAEIYRQINRTYRDNYDLLMDSGLYRELTKSDLLIPHVEADHITIKDQHGYKIIKPENIEFISYPYEWSFSQLKDAALTTLNIQKQALGHDMSLKDSSAYNIQFKNGKPILIDTLSFEQYKEGSPWIAYRQFCQHFLAPLALMSYVDIRLSQLLRIYIDGVPLDLASKLLPFGSRFKFSILTHIHLHAKAQQMYSKKKVETKKKVSRFSLLALIESLSSVIKSLRWKPAGTEWADYYDNTNYSDEAVLEKKKIVSDFIGQVDPESVWDMGANEGTYSRLAADRGIHTMAFDIDPSAVEKNYLQAREKGETCILPLLLDLSNPSPGIGWENRERDSILDRGPADMVMALALIHHLAISNNVPFSKIADLFKRLCHTLVIEFIPKTDSQVQRLLSTREDIFRDYNQQAFEAVFNKHFMIKKSVNIKGSQRILYLMQKKNR